MVQVKVASLLAVIVSQVKINQDYKNTTIMDRNTNGNRMQIMH